MSFKEKKYEIVRQAISQDLIKHVQISCDIFESVALKFNPATKEVPYPFSDEQTKNSFAWYSSLFGESLLVLLKDKISTIVDKELLETYSFYRTYYSGAILDKHVDRPSCQYSATLCVENGNCSWPIFFELEGKTEVKVDLEPGDMIVYMGEFLPHWREPYSGNKHKQVFLHYIDANGPYAKTNRYDARELLGLPANMRSGDRQ